MRAASESCRGCELCTNGTRVVFGEGPATARLVLVGEQPGDHEERAGRPFVGPSGQLLDRALADAGLDRGQLYLTNAVKHFRHEMRGKRRLHKKPRGREVTACRPWLVAELELLRPLVLVCLGSTAAAAILGPRFRLTQDRGRVIETPFCSRTLATYHPSAALSPPDRNEAKRLYSLIVRDLRKAARLLAGETPGPDVDPR